MFHKRILDFEVAHFSLNEENLLTFRRNKRAETQFEFSQTGTQCGFIYFKSIFLLQIIGYLKQKRNFNIFLPMDRDVEDEKEEKNINDEFEFQEEPKIRKERKLPPIYFLRVEYKKKKYNNATRSTIFVLQKCRTTEDGMRNGPKLIIKSESAINNLITLEKQIEACLMENSNFDMILKLSTDTLVDCYLQDRFKDGKQNPNEHVFKTEMSTERVYIRNFLNSDSKINLFKKILLKKLQKIYPGRYFTFLNGLISIIRTREIHRQQIERQFFKKVKFMQNI